MAFVVGREDPKAFNKLLGCLRHYGSTDAYVGEAGRSEDPEVYHKSPWLSCKVEIKHKPAEVRAEFMEDNRFRVSGRLGKEKEHESCFCLEPGVLTD